MLNLTFCRRSLFLATQSSYIPKLQPITFDRNGKDCCFRFLTEIMKLTPAILQRLKLCFTYVSTACSCDSHDCLQRGHDLISDLLRNVWSAYRGFESEIWPDCHPWFVWNILFSWIIKVSFGRLVQTYAWQTLMLLKHYSKRRKTNDTHSLTHNDKSSLNTLKNSSLNFQKFLY